MHEWHTYIHICNGCNCEFNCISSFQKFGSQHCFFLEKLPIFFPAENWQKSPKIGKNRPKSAKIAQNRQKSTKIGKTASQHRPPIEGATHGAGGGGGADGFRPDDQSVAVRPVDGSEKFLSLRCYQVARPPPCDGKH
jgi:hypothetical protein